MANIIIFDQTTNKVKEYLISVNTPDFSSRPDVLVNPVIPSNVPLKFLKVSGGLVVEMSQTEKDAVTTAESLAVADAETERLGSLDTKVSIAKLTDASLPKIDAAIDAIANLNDAKAFLKKLARYLASK